MNIVKNIRLIDGTEHSSKERATRHLFNLLSSGTDLEMFEALSNKSALKVKNYFIDNFAQISRTMQIIQELKDVEACKEL